MFQCLSLYCLIEIIEREVLPVIVITMHQKSLQPKAMSHPHMYQKLHRKSSEKDYWVGWIQKTVMLHLHPVFRKQREQMWNTQSQTLLKLISIKTEQGKEEMVLMKMKVIIQVPWRMLKK